MSNPLVDVGSQLDSGQDAASLLLVHNVVTNPVHAILWRKMRLRVRVYRPGLILSAVL